MIQKTSLIFLFVKSFFQSNLGNSVHQMDVALNKGTEENYSASEKDIEDAKKTTSAVVIDGNPKIETKKKKQKQNFSDMNISEKNETLEFTSASTSGLNKKKRRNKNTDRVVSQSLEDDDQKNEKAAEKLNNDLESGPSSSAFSEKLFISTESTKSNNTTKNTQHLETKKTEQITQNITNSTSKCADEDQLNTLDLLKELYDQNKNKPFFLDFYSNLKKLDHEIDIKNRNMILEHCNIKFDPNNVIDFNDFENVLYQEFSKNINKDKVLNLNEFYKEFGILILNFEKTGPDTHTQVSYTFGMFARFMFFCKFLENIKDYENFYKKIEDIEVKEQNILFLFLFIDHLKNQYKYILQFLYHYYYALLEIANVEKKKQDNYRTVFLSSHDPLNSTKNRKTLDENHKLQINQVKSHLKVLLFHNHQIVINLKKSIFSNKEIVQYYININKLMESNYKFYENLYS